MIRAMDSGVAGMKAHLSKLDVIGNNIANANTYGFKSSRATFRDMYYQQLRSASGGTATRGGINPSGVGYGSQLSSVDLLMTQSAMTSTGNPLDVAITGEGFIQVMDPDGNIFYTKAGMLDIDPATGAVIDTNGNFVLGTGASDGKLNSINAGTSKIMIQVPPVQAHLAEVTKEISGKKLTISSSNQNKAANVSFSFTSSTTLADGKTPMPDNLRAVAVMDSGGKSISIRLNETAEFTSLSDLQEEINRAITTEYGGEHPGGTFTFQMEPEPEWPLTGKEIAKVAGADYEGAGFTPAVPEDPADTPVVVDGAFSGGFKISDFGLKFSGTGDAAFTVEKQAAEGDNPEGYQVTLTVGGQTYTGFIKQENAADSTGNKTIILQNGTSETDTITVSYPNATKIDAAIAGGTATDAAIGTMTPNLPTKNLGLGGETFQLQNGTAFTEQNVSNLTGIGIGADGTISGTSAAGTQVLGRIDLVTFGNPKGLMQTGNSYFASTENSGDPKAVIAGEDGSGELKNSALEMSNVDLSQEFSDMITTQRGFQANSRLITVSDTMLEELINLKR